MIIPDERRKVGLSQKVKKKKEFEKILTLEGL